MSKEKLIGVYQDTILRVEKGEYHSNLENEKIISKNINVSFNDSSPFKIDVINDDCINVAKSLATKGKTCLLNMASYKRPGGGVRNGAMAQEEELARRSNLLYGLNPKYYPLSIDEFIYTKDVSFFKDKNYNVIDEFKCDVITIAAVNLNIGTPINYELITKQKIEDILFYPCKNGCRNLVLSAFGCGVFKNDPNFISRLFKKLIDDGYGELYDSITFSILNDRNSVGSNYEIFYNTFNNNN